MNIEIRTMPINALQAHPGNPRVTLQPGKHKEYAAIKTSLDRFGLVEPIVWNERTGHIVSGHQRVRIMRNNHVDEIDVAVVDLDEHEEAALLVAMNKIEGRWDDGKLAALVDELGDSIDFDLPSVDLDIELPSTPEQRHLCENCGTVWYE